MPDTPLHQGAGLLGLGPAAGPQLIAMVRHGDERSELPLLWQLSQTLVALGYEATVLDASQRESPSNPGLEQLLNYQGAPATSAGTAQCNVLACARGIQTLTGPGSQAAHGLLRLGGLFACGEILILYADLDAMLGLLHGSGVQPLLLVSDDEESLLRSYLVLKRLLRDGQLEPTILNMMGGATGQISGVTHSLSECARSYLGYEVNPISMDASGPGVGAQMRYLATRMLESAITLDGAAYGLDLHAHARTPEQRSH